MPRDSKPTPRASVRPAFILNLILPGTGLILCRREWLGLSFAVLFGIGCNVAIAGWLIAPAAIPSWLSVLAILLAAATWLAAQVLIRRHLPPLVLNASLHESASVGRGVVRVGDDEVQDRENDASCSDVE